MYKNKNTKFRYAHSYGFTLTEVIIVIVIIAALALVLIPNLINMMPDDHSIKYKKIFNTVQEVVNDIINDQEECRLYDVDSGTDYSESPLSYCFRRGTENGVVRVGELICERLNIVGGSCPSYKGEGDNDNITFQTTDGTFWIIPRKTTRPDVFKLDCTSAGAGAGCAEINTIFIDIDGDNSFPENGSLPTQNSDSGIYRISVGPDGKVYAGTKSSTDDPEDKLLLSSPTN